MKNRIIGFVEFLSDAPKELVEPKIVRCIALNDIADFSLLVKPTEEEYEMLLEQGFVEYEPDNIDGMYHYVRKEYLV